MKFKSKIEIEIENEVLDIILYYDENGNPVNWDKLSEEEKQEHKIRYSHKLNERVIEAITNRLNINYDDEYIFDYLDELYIDNFDKLKNYNIKIKYKVENGSPCN